MKRRAAPHLVSAEAPAAAEPRTGPVIELRKVTKTYGMGDIQVHALRGTTLTIERGDYVAIMGASGSGKSTMMNILGCLDLPSIGTYKLNGIDVSKLQDSELADIRNREIGFVFQSFNLIPRTDALSQVEMPLRYAGYKRADRKRLALAGLSAVGLKDRVTHHPSELSGGQQQRVAIARALVTNPAILLADEPTGALDSVSSAEVLHIFDRLNAMGRTVIVITHEAEVAEHAKRVINLRDGRVVGDRRQGPISLPPPKLQLVGAL